MRKKKVSLVLLLMIVLIVSSISFAHGGRTDSSGGHKDNQNKSGLGYYHYHHGSGPHLHSDGVCPYTTPKVTKTVASEYTYYKDFSKEDIKKIQTHLNDLGYSCGEADGVIGSKTIKAIKSIQDDNKLISDGEADTSTLKLIYQNDTVDIKAVQLKLNELGYDCGVADGISGKKTVAQIKAFQTDNKLAASGKLNDYTVKKLGLE